jgi:nitrate/nitrite-specific signal transduction histidine kinase
VQAHLTVASQPGHGTEVRLRWEGTPKKEAI